MSGRTKNWGSEALACQLINSLICKLHRTVLLINDEIQGIGDLGHLTGIVLKIIGLGLQHYVLHTFLG